MIRAAVVTSYKMKEREPSGVEESSIVYILETDQNYNPDIAEDLMSRVVDKVRESLNED